MSRSPWRRGDDATLLFLAKEGGQLGIRAAAVVVGERGGSARAAMVAAGLGRRRRSNGGGAAQGGDLAEVNEWGWAGLGCANRRLEGTEGARVFGG